MDRKKINEEISEIRSLMNLNEELPYMSPVGPNPGIGLWQGIKNFFNPKDADKLQDLVDYLKKQNNEETIS